MTHEGGERFRTLRGGHNIGRHTGIPTNLVFKLANEGAIPCYRHYPGGNLYARVDALDRWMNESELGRAMAGLPIERRLAR